MDDVGVVAVLGQYVGERLREAHVVFDDEDLHPDLPFRCAFSLPL